MLTEKRSQASGSDAPTPICKFKGEGQNLVRFVVRALVFVRLDRVLKLQSMSAFLLLLLHRLFAWIFDVSASCAHLKKQSSDMAIFIFSLRLDKPSAIELPRSSSNSSLDNIVTNENICTIQFSESFTYKNGAWKRRCESLLSTPFSLRFYSFSQCLAGD